MAKRNKATLEIRLWENGTKKLPIERSDISELLAPHVEHVSRMCAQGYLSGEIVEENFDGWWALKVEE